MHAKYNIKALSQSRVIGYPHSGPGSISATQALQVVNYFSVGTTADSKDLKFADLQGGSSEDCSYLYNEDIVHSSNPSTKHKQYVLKQADVRSDTKLQTSGRHN